MRPPEVIHWCAQHCTTLRLDDGPPLNKLHYGNRGAGAIWVVQKFDAGEILMERTDFGRYPGRAIVHGQLSPDGNRVVNGVIDWVYHPCCGLGKASFEAAWGAALNTVPGSDAERQRMAVTSRLPSGLPPPAREAPPAGGVTVSSTTLRVVPTLPARPPPTPTYATPLDGEYFATTGNYYFGGQTRHPIRVTTQGNRVSIVRLLPTSAGTPQQALPDGDPFLQGAYTSGRVTGALASNAQGSWAAVIVNVLNPDHIQIDGTNYYRYAESVGSMDCDAGNRYHVEHPFALKRGMIAVLDKNPAQAACWFGVAAVQGNRVAQNNYGQALYEGRGIKQNHDEAFQWILKSATQGEFGGQLNLSRMYQLGQGTAKDEENAVYWFRVASRNPAAPESMRRAEAARIMPELMGAVLRYAFLRSPACDASILDTPAQDARRREYISEEGIDCSFR
ncbi:MAG: tetratricopeptide repeat protein [Bryobacteraceae bacterium]